MSRALAGPQLIRKSEVLLDSPHPLEQIREQLPLGWNASLRGGDFKIAFRGH
jgi:hypothetical protein